MSLFVGLTIMLCLGCSDLWAQRSDFNGLNMNLGNLSRLSHLSRRDLGVCCLLITVEDIDNTDIYTLTAVGLTAMDRKGVRTYF